MRREPGIRQQFHSALKVAGLFTEAACPPGNPAVASPSFRTGQIGLPMLSRFDRRADVVNWHGWPSCRGQRRPACLSPARCRPKPNSRDTSRKVAAPDFAEGRMAKGKRSEQAVRARKWPQTRGDLVAPNRKAKSSIGLWSLISLT